MSLCLLHVIMWHAMTGEPVDLHSSCKQHHHLVCVFVFCLCCSFLFKVLRQRSCLMHRLNFILLYLSCFDEMIFIFLATCYFASVGLSVCWYVSPTLWSTLEYLCKYLIHFHEISYWHLSTSGQSFYLSKSHLDYYYEEQKGFIDRHVSDVCLCCFCLTFQMCNLISHCRVISSTLWNHGGRKGRTN